MIIIFRAELYVTQVFFQKRFYVGSYMYYIPYIYLSCFRDMVRVRVWVSCFDPIRH